MTAPTLAETGKPTCDLCGAPNEVVMGVIPGRGAEMMINGVEHYVYYSLRCTRLRVLGGLRNLRKVAKGHTNEPIPTAKRG